MVSTARTPKKEPKPAKRGKNNSYLDSDTAKPTGFCYNCTETFSTDDPDAPSTIACTGSCGREFHTACCQPDIVSHTRSQKKRGKKSLATSSPDKVIVIGDKCQECSTGQYKCFICKTHDDQVSKCSHPDCTKWYHLSCFKPSDAYHYGIEKGLEEGQFICPQHFCLTCYIEHTDDSIAKSKDSLLRCVKCPTAYHYSDDCLHAGTWNIIPDKFILCPDHLDRAKFPSHNFLHCFVCMDSGDLICCETCPASFHKKCLQYDVDVNQSLEVAKDDSPDQLNDTIHPSGDELNGDDVFTSETPVKKSDEPPKDKVEQDLSANSSLGDPVATTSASNTDAPSNTLEVTINSKTGANAPSNILAVTTNSNPGPDTPSNSVEFTTNSNTDSDALVTSQLAAGTSSETSSTAPAKKTSKTFYCSSCIRRKPLLYGELVWAKIGHYRWWPAIITPIGQIPDNIFKKPSARGQFAVQFLGSHDYYWLWKGRVFSYVDKDAELGNKITQAKGSLSRDYKKALEEAKEKYQEYLKSRQEVINKRASKVPPKYNKIKVNKYIGEANKVSKNLTFGENDRNSDNTSEEVDCPLTSRSGRSVRTSSLAFNERCCCGLPPKPDEKQEQQTKPCLTSKCVNYATMLECTKSNCSVKEDKCCNRRFQNRTYAKVKQFYTGTRGWGLKALEDIPKDEFVIEYVGELITEKEAATRIKMSVGRNEVNFYHLTLDKNLIIDAGPSGNLARFMNHSCAPNCRSEKWLVGNYYRMGLFAIRDIKQGEELTFNYNLTIHGSEQTPCKCGAATCSGFIGSKPTKITAKSNTPAKSNAKRRRSKAPKRVKRARNGPGAQSEGSATA